jgi:hypothetical protein
MRLDIKAMALAIGLLWGGAMLVMSAANLVWPTYGRAFLDMIASVYPGYTGAATAGQVVVGSLYGFVDGAIGGALLAWLYNRLARA